MGRKQTVADALNTIADKSANLSRAGLPEVTDLKSFQRYGEIITSNTDYINEFSGLLNRIFEVIIWNKAWRNPLEFLFKDGEYGDSIEEVFVNTAKVFGYDPYGDGADQWKRVAPDVRAAIHKYNLEFFSEQTVYDKGLRRAFLSFDGFYNYFQGVITAMYNGISLTLYEVTKYLMADYMLSTGAAGLILPPNSTPQDYTVALKSYASKVKFISTKYNSAGVESFSDLEDLYLITTPEVDAKQSVDVLAYMFNVDLARVDYKRIVVDSFSEFNWQRITNAFKTPVRRFSEAEIEQLKNVKFFLCDRKLLLMYDMLHQSEVARNKMKLYQNYFFHFWGIASYSPFATGIVISEGTPNTEVTGWKNPYSGKEITIGRDNRFYAIPATAFGMFTDQISVEPKITGNALTKIPEHEGWYQAVNQRGMTSTITYTKPAGASADMEDLVITVTTV